MSSIEMSLVEIRDAWRGEILTHQHRIAFDFTGDPTNDDPQLVRELPTTHILKGGEYNG